MKFARTVFLLAGIYGVLVLVPLYFLEDFIGRKYPPPLTHPEYYYGFIGVAIAWQLAFFIIHRDPVRYRLIMLPGVFEKWAYVIAVAILFAQGRVPVAALAPAAIDATWGLLFLVAYFKVARG